MHLIERPKEVDEMKRSLLPVIVGAALATAGSASAVAIPASHADAELVIRHSKAGCHTWDRGHVRAGADQAIRVHTGHTLSIVNRDAVAHTLVQLSGPAVIPLTALPNRGVSTAFVLQVPGTYTFRTTEAAHRAFMLDARDVPDHTLTLKVIVASEYQ